jgi:alkyldihydroxyacetonephosphate synthase
MSRRRKHWGWGYEDEQLPAAQLEALAAAMRDQLRFGGEVEAPAPLPALAAPRLAAPARLRELLDTSDHDRARHAYGCSYRDLVRGFRGDYGNPPDVVAHPRDERELEAVLEWALGAGAAVIPYGGGTGVVGGVEPIVGDGYEGVVTIDMQALDQVLEVDETALAARIQAGASGPVLERALRERGLTLRHFPQSFELQTLGGAIATRAGGHYATARTRIDDFVESVRALTPAGVWASRRLPGSGAGVAPDSLLLGSEGTLGVITEAWVRVVRRPAQIASTTVSFPSFEAGCEAARAIVQSGLTPANCRLLEADEARLTGAGDGTAALLLLAFESAELDVGGSIGQAVALCLACGGTPREPRRRTPAAGGDDRKVAAGENLDPAASWREAFVRAPYLRDALVAIGVLAETFETAITWERLAGLRASVAEAARQALREVCGGGTVTCRLTHVYPDGAAPYFTVLAPARRGAELEQWDAVKRAASAAVLDGGGTITHHHAVGRDHRPWYDRERPEPFAAALAAAKAAVDPAWALNPGVLIDRPPRRSRDSS